VSVEVYVSHGCELKSLIIFLIITRRLEMQSCMLYSPERQEMGMDGNFGSTDLFLKPINIEQGSPGPYVMNSASPNFDTVN